MSDIRGLDRAQAQYDNQEPDDRSGECADCGSPVEEGETLCRSCIKEEMALARWEGERG